MAESTATQIPRPLHFVVRPGTKTETRSRIIELPGPIVPLIALDELPQWLNIVGVPRELTVEQTAGLANLGTQPAQKGKYEIRIEDGQRVAKESAGVAPAEQPPEVQSNTDSNDEGLGRSLHASPEPVSDRRREKMPSTVTSPVPDHQRPESQNPAREPAATGVPPPLTAAVPPYTVPPLRHAAAGTHARAPREPLYCRHWCHHGTCRWGDACRYAHAMPTTAQGLAAVGLKGLPRWWTAALSPARSESRREREFRTAAAQVRRPDPHAVDEDDGAAEEHIAALAARAAAVMGERPGPAVQRLQELREALALGMMMAGRSSLEWTRILDRPTSSHIRELLGKAGAADCAPSSVSARSGGVTPLDKTAPRAKSRKSSGREAGPARAAAVPGEVGEEKPSASNKDEQPGLIEGKLVDV